LSHQILFACSWHDHKRARLRLLLRALDSLDCIAIQELYSTTVDARYRDMVLREAAAAGFHYAVASPRVPRWPALLLNSGTLLLSRYAISQSRSIVFEAKAMYDLLVVNRGASWARVQLPTGHVLHLFTCHACPPLKEIAERTTERLNHWLQDAQHQQLEELVRFIAECVGPDKKAWEDACAKDAAAALSPLSPSEQSQVPPAPQPPRARPFSVVLAGDLNVDAGCQRYFWLRHELHKLDLGLRDVFAAEQGGPTQATTEAVEESLKSQHEIGCINHDDSEEEAAAVRECAAQCGSLGMLQPFDGTSFSSNTAAPSYAETSNPTSSRMVVMPNRWSAARGNRREPFSPQQHWPTLQDVMPPKGHAISWPATFGQVLRHPHSPEPPRWPDGSGAGGSGRPGSPSSGSFTHPTSAASNDSAIAVSTPSSSSATLSRGGSPSPPPPHLCSRHQEEFLTHPSLLGSHTTHDYCFSSLQPRATVVEPFLAPHALRRLHVLQHEAQGDAAQCTEAQCVVADATAAAIASDQQPDEDADENLTVAGWADQYDGRPLPSLSARGRGHRSRSGSSRRDGGGTKRSPSRTPRPPPYTQLSDHCALIATFMMPEESLQRARANSRA
jgi:endonuclease/exonuclease/phosphatase family metal-dependent hydrolase